MPLIFSLGQILERSPLCLSPIKTVSGFSPSARQKFENYLTKGDFVGFDKVPTFCYFLQAIIEAVYNSQFLEFIMPPKKLIWSFVFLAAAFIIVGDSLEFFPEPMQNASFQSREFIVGLWPEWLKPKETNQRTEKAIEEVENQANP